jgi:hypothetical protein
MTPGERQRVVDYALVHGPLAASRRFGVPLGSAKGWLYRHRQRQANHARWLEQARQGEAEARVSGELPAEVQDRPAVADPNPTEAELAYRMAHGICLRCGGVGIVGIPAVMRGSLVLRRARRMRCPDCGGVPRVVQVVEHGRDTWVQGMALAAELGAGWSPEQWAMIRRGEVDPDGYRISGTPDD